jgi:hypothetical protein
MIAEQDIKKAKAPKKIRPAFQELKQICRRLGIHNTVDYKSRYKSEGLPAHPERIFASEWVSYSNFFEIPEFLEYEQLKELIKPKKFKSGKEYKTFVKDQKDPSLPFDPQTVYENQWENWFRFLGNPEPFKPEFINPYYVAWADEINIFMKTARGGGTKETSLCRFVRLFTEEHDHSKSPQDFLTRENVNLKPLREILESLSTDNLRRNMIIATNEFLDSILERYLTIEDEDTGEIVRVMGARNPCSLLLNIQSISAPQRSESTKPYLQYHFVKKSQEWIIPKAAKHFLDLKHLHVFDADWIKIEAALVDPSDPDCVVRRVGDNYFLWSPVDWIQTFTLTKVPLRGRQIAYCDSGEADEYIAEPDGSGKIIWRENSSSFAGMTKNQSLIKRMVDDQIGMYVTTNKTSNQGQGYSIPWMPDDLAYWLIKLRKWQQKYNPLKQPTSWLESVRTNLNEPQRKAKGINCFLFRQFDDVEPRNVGNALTPRLAAALYHIQPTNLALATLSGNASLLNRYDSKYTPHSMRVSLITAYVMEMGMPIEVVMKIVGHASVIMTIYYTKVSHNDIRQRLEEGEKIALKSQAQSIQRTIEQNRIDELKNQLVASNEDLLRSLSNEVPAGNYVFRDYGICPFAASRCEDGGEPIGGSQINAPTPSGYLGMQNCLRCRHFVTGPAFIGGLLSITNEILLHANTQSTRCASFQNKIQTISDFIVQLERQEYVANAKKQPFDSTQRQTFETQVRSLESEYESAAKKLDMLLCDLQSCYGHINRCQKIVNNLQEDSNNEDRFALIAMEKAEITIEMNEVSHFEQLQEVCENATIYQSASAENAILPRTQILDRMALFNEIAPSLFLMTEEQQLVVGNELFKLLKSRLKTWEKIIPVVECKVRLEDLIGHEQISKSEIKLITHSPLSIEG